MSKTSKPLLHETVRRETEISGINMGTPITVEFDPVPPPSVQHVYVALNEVVSDISKVGLAKTRENTQGPRFKFRGIDELMNLVSPIFAQRKLLVLPTVVAREQTERTSGNGNALFSVVLRVEFTFVSAVDGSKHVVTTFGEAFDSGDKATNKAMSAAYKYALLQSLCIPVEGEGVDADAETHTVQAAPPTGYDAFFAEAVERSATGTKALRAFGVQAIKEGKHALWGHLVERDARWAKLKQDAEAVDKQAGGEQ